MSIDIKTVIQQYHNRIIVCGESCTGKTYFGRHYIKDQKIFYGNMNETLANMEFNHIIGINGDPFVCDHNVTPDHIIGDHTFHKGKLIIMLGVSYSVWKERIKERIKEHTTQHLKHISKYTKNIYIDNYVRYIRCLIQHKNPYILVESVKEYPILNETQFFEMLRENSNGDSINT